jgi:hypothetical protein
MTRTSTAPHEHVIQTRNRQRLLGLDADLSPRLRAPARMQRHAQDAVDGEPGVPEMGVGGVNFPFAPRGSTVSGRQRNSHPVLRILGRFDRRVLT